MLRVFNAKKYLTKKILNPPRKKTKAPNSFYKKYKIIEKEVFGSKILTIQKKKKYTKKHIFYLHGGAYVLQATTYHWRFLDKIIQKSESIVSFIDYPLAPEASYKETFSMILKSYKQLFGSSKKKEIIIMGYSAGGGLALAFSEELQKYKKLPQPSKIILLSPWLDIHLNSTYSKTLQQKDLVLNPQALTYAGKTYSKGKKENYLLSPINGNFRKLGKIALFIGTSEIFYKDSLIFKKKLEQEKKYIAFYPYKNMQHGWHLAPIPEAKKAIEEICNFIKN